MTIAIPVFALMLYLGKQAKNRKRDNTPYDEVKKVILNSEYLVGILAFIRICNNYNCICI